MTAKPKMTGSTKMVVLKRLVKNWIGLVIGFELAPKLDVYWLLK
jgi:hypothetical protein